MEVKLIVARPVLRKVGVFDGPDTDDFGHLGPFFRAQFRAVFIDHTASDLNGFVEDSGETDGIAFARFQGSAGLVEDGSEGNVAEVDFIEAPGLGGFEELMEVVALAVIDDVKDLVWVPAMGAVADGGEVGGGVSIGTVAFTHNHGRLCGLTEADSGAFAIGGDALGFEVGDDIGEHGVVERFAELDVETDVEAIVDHFKHFQAVGHELAPELAIFFVAGVKFGGLLTGLIAHQSGGSGLGLNVGPGRAIGAGYFRGYGLSFVGFPSLQELERFLIGFFVGFGRFDRGLNRLVEASELVDRVGLVSLFVEEVFIAPEDHSELGTPVTEVVVADDFMAEGGEGSGERFADDGGPDVAHVHGFGDIGGAVIDDDGFGCLGSFEAESVVFKDFTEECFDLMIAETDVEEPRAGEFWLVGHGFEVDGIGDFICDFTGIAFRGFGDGHGAVGLIVAKFRVGGGTDGVGEGWSLGFVSDGQSESLAEEFQNIHERSRVPVGLLDRKCQFKQGAYFSADFEGRIFPVESWSIAPDIFKVIEFTTFWREEVDDDVAKIEECPAAGFGLFEAEFGFLELLHFKLDLAGDGVGLTAAGHGGDDKKVDHAGELAHVENENVLSLAVLRKLGGQAGQFIGFEQAGGVGAGHG